MISPRIFLTALLTALAVLAAGSPEAEGHVGPSVTFEGGGWGHGVGLSQYGAYGQAVADPQATGAEIATYYYQGTSVQQLSDVLPADSFLLNYAEPLWVGLLQNRTMFTFIPRGGDLILCQAGDGEGPCPKSVTPRNGELWKFAVSGSGCQFEKMVDGSWVNQGNPGDCKASIDWDEAAGVRVELPDLGRSYAKGTIKIRQAPTGFHVSLAIEIEDYVAGIAEMPTTWPAAALEAQALAARSYAIAKAQQREIYERIGTLADPGLSQKWKDICWCHVRATTADQVYIGWDQEQNAAWAAATANTAGQVITHPDPAFTENGVIEAFYASSTSGVTESNVGGFGSSVPYPYLQSVPDPWSSDPVNPNASWTKEVGEDVIIAALATTTKAWQVNFEYLTAVELINGPPGAMVRFTGVVGGSTQSVEVPGWWMRSAFGLKSGQVEAVTGNNLGTPPPPSTADLPVLHDPDTGIWTYKQPNGALTSIYYGNPGDYAFMGDWDCDGVATPGLYRQSDGYVYLRNSNTQGVADISFFFGNPGDIPIAGDFDGDGCDTISIYRPSEAKFYIINRLGSGDEGLGEADYSFFYGVVGDVPFVGDWDGDGIDTPGLRRDSDGFVYLRNSNTAGFADIEYSYGDPGDVVFVGDWDGDGDDSLGLYRPSNGWVYLRNTNDSGVADISYDMGGEANHRPVAGTR